MKKDFAGTLKELRIKSGYTQKQVYEMLGIPQSTFSSWEIGKAEPSASMTLKLCEIYHVDDVLSAFGYDGYNEDGTIQLNKDEESLIEKYRSLDPYVQETISLILDREVKRAEMDSERDSPIADQEEISPPLYIISYYQRLASAGNGEYLFDDIPTETMEVPANEVSEQADFVIGVNGDSMEPTYHDGDKVYVEKMEEIPVGSIGIFTRGPECFIKELGNDRLISHNKEYADIPASEDIRCVGLVLGKVEED